MGTPGPCLRREQAWVFCRLVSPAEEACALAVALLISCTRALGLTDTHIQHHVRTTTTTTTTAHHTPLTPPPPCPSPPLPLPCPPQPPPPPPKSRLVCDLDFFAMPFRDFMMSTMAGVGIATGAAKRRRERRLRSWLRHERMTVAMALAEVTHHTAPRGQKTARPGERRETSCTTPRA